MEEKIFNLIESMYNEMNNRFEQMDNRFEQIDKRFDEVNAEIAKNRQEITKNRQEIAKNREEITKNRTSIVGLENKLGAKIDVLFDGYKQNTEAIDRLETKFDALAEKVGKQEVEIRVIKGAK